MAAILTKAGRPWRAEGVAATVPALIQRFEEQAGARSSWAVLPARLVRHSAQ